MTSKEEVNKFNSSQSLGLKEKVEKTLKGKGEEKKEKKEKKEKIEKKEGKDIEKKNGIDLPTNSPRPKKKSKESSAQKKLKKKLGLKSLELHKDKVPEEYLPISHIHLVNKASYADITFQFVNGQKIPAHSCIILSRCPALTQKSHAPVKKIGTLRKVASREQPGSVFDVRPGISPSTFIELLNFVYSGKVNFEELNNIMVLELMAAAILYEGLERLEWLCETRTIEKLSMKNIYEVLACADKLKLQYIKEYCLHFAVSHWEKFIKSRESLRKLGVDLFQDAVISYQTYLQGELKPLPGHQQWPNNYINELKNLHNSMKGNDISFKLIEKNFLGVSGSIYRAHRAIVSSRSPELTLLCNQVPWVQNPVSTNTSKDLTSVNNNSVAVKGITTEGFTCLLKWLYYGESVIPSRAAVELVTFCKDYGLPELHKIAVFSLKNGVNDRDIVLEILHLGRLTDQPDFFYKEFEKIKPLCIDFIINNLTKVNLANLREQRLYHKIAADLVIALREKYFSLHPEKRLSISKEPELEKEKEIIPEVSKPASVPFHEEQPSLPPPFDPSLDTISQSNILPPPPTEDVPPPPPPIDDVPPPPL